MIAMLTAATAVNPQSSASTALPSIPLYSQQLADELEPSKTAPWVATYRSGRKVLCFVAGDHVFTAENPTIEAIRRSFADVNPSRVIVEGFPTAMGESPEPILESLRRRDAPDADPYAKSEAIFAVSQARSRNVPFVGGEPTIVEEMNALVAKRYNRDDVRFAMLLRGLGVSRRSGGMPAGDTEAFSMEYRRAARSLAYMTQTESMSEKDFIASYLRIVGTDPISDVEMPNRSNPGTETVLQRMSADNMRIRDEHLFSTILRELAEHDRVLVVYGSSHWTTLARALQDRLGKPVILTEFAPSKK
jgi:hypothetical protein